jgi:hypothetical protein
MRGFVGVRLPSKIGRQVLGFRALRIKTFLALVELAVLSMKAVNCD